jgi:hypothetical protein
MGLRTAEFWRTTPVNFERMWQAFERNEELKAVHTREILATIWNVNIDPKKGSVEGKQLWPLGLDDHHRLPDRTRKKTIARKGMMSREAYLERIQKMANQPTPVPVDENPDS